MYHPLLRISGIALAIAMFVSALPAHAEAPDPSCMQDSRCAAFIASARLLSQAQDFAGALLVYQRAFAQVPDPGVLVSIGRMQQKNGQLEQAAESYRRYLNSPRHTDDRELRRKAQEWLAAVLSQATPANAQHDSPMPASQMHLVAANHKTSQQLSSNERQASRLRKILMSWWLWSAVGLVSMATATGLAIALTIGREPKPLPGISAIDLTF